MADSPPIPLARVVGRVTVAFILDLIESGRKNQGFLDGLISIAIVQANITPILRDPELNLAYARYDRPPPDELRRPVSVNAVATSLRLPYETVRRRVALLGERGLVETTRRGLYVPTSVLSSPDHKLMVEHNYELLRRLYFRLQDLGVLHGLPAGVAPWADDAPPLRAVSRVLIDYFLRVMEVVRTHVGDTAKGLILLSVARANTEHFPDDLRGSDGLDAEDFVSDALRKPVRIATVAGRLNMPVETVRRHVADLVAEDYLVRSAAGLVVPAANLAKPHLMKFVLANIGNLQRMFSQVARLGVLASWDLERAAPGAPLRQSAAPF